MALLSEYGGDFELPPEGKHPARLVKFVWQPKLHDLELIADLSYGGMSSARIAAALCIPPDVFSRWTARLAAAAALSPEDADLLIHPPRRAVQPPPPPPPAPHDPRVIAELMFEAPPPASPLP
jgi:hypothetical protein